MRSHRRRFSPDEIRAFGLDSGTLIHDLHEAYTRVGGKRGERFDARFHAMLVLLGQLLAEVWQVLDEKPSRSDDEAYDQE